MVERFIEEGASVFFSGRRVDVGADVARATGGVYIEADAALEADAARTVAQARATGGRIDVLVNNAGGATSGARLETVSLEDFDRTFAVHVRGAMAHMKYAAPAMRAQRSGSIINIASIAGHRAGYAGTLGYSAAKAALIHLSRCAGLELGEDNVRVNSISPGGIATGIFGKAYGLEGSAAEESAEKMKSMLAKMQAVPRAGVPEDIANAAVFLASDESSFVNGTDLVVDGGAIGGIRASEVKAGRQATRALFE